MEWEGNKQNDCANGRSDGLVGPSSRRDAPRLSENVPGAISTLLLLQGVAVGRIAARGGSRQYGDIAMAIFASCAIG
jgi:hypothetical protein